MRSAIAILDFTNFFIDNITKLHKQYQKKYITFKEGNCVKYFKDIKIKENEVITEVMKIDNFLEKREIENLIKENLLKYELIVILKECIDDKDLKVLNCINEKLRDKNLRVLNLLYTKDKNYNNKDILGKITMFLGDKKEILLRKTISIYNSIFNLMKNNKKILFDLCNEKNIPMIDLNIDNIKSIGEGVLYILKSFKEIQYLDVLILTLISKKKVSVEDVYYIKDPLEEYMYCNKKIIVQELTQEDYKENLTINLIGLKK